MISLAPFQIIELIIGLFTFWVGTYQLSQNLRSYFSWLIFVLFLSIGYLVFSDPIIFNTQSYQSYILWQKLTDWPLFLIPALLLHIAVAINGNIRKIKPYLISAYSFSLFLFVIDLKGGLILQEGIVRFEDYRRVDSFAPGIFMIPFVLYCTICFSAGIYQLNLVRIKQKEKRYVSAIIGLIVLTVTAVITGISYYIYFPAAQNIFSVGLTLGVLFLVYFLLSYYQLINNERNIFDKSFVYRTILLLVITLVYLFAFLVQRKQFGFIDLVFMIVLTLLVIISHSLYEWINTFINDLIYNRSSGLSVVNDQEVGDAIKNYSSPARLENSSLLRLNVLKRNKDKAPIDALRNVIKESIDYFKPEDDKSRRTKRNLKYHLLTMIAFDQAEEGQILWELGFEEYPVRIMTKETKDRPPMFKATSPSDYTYVSRNAFIALKKEAIHDVTWRISYLEKLSKKALGR